MPGAAPTVWPTGGASGPSSSSSWGPSARSPTATPPTCSALADDYRAKGVAVYGVHSDPDVTPEAAAAHAEEYSLTFPMLLDPFQDLAGQVGVQVTPEAAVLDADGQVLYRGRIDDRYNPGDGKRRATAQTPELRHALDAVLAGRTPAVTETEGYGCPLPDPRIVADGGEITFTEHVAPILWKRCAGCHRPGEVGPFSLLTYKDASRRASFIKDITESRRMPPWKPVPGFGTFRNENRLSRRELAILAAWADTGAPEGAPDALPEPPTFPDGWQLGEPDLVLSLPEPYPIPASGDDIYRAFVIPMGLTKDQPIAAVEFRPGNRKVVHHARLYMDPTPESRERDQADPGPGFVTVGGNDIPKPGLGAWIPGALTRMPPPGVGRIIPAGSDLVMLVHYHGSGKPETDHSRVGIYFSKTPIERTMTSIPMSTAKIDIPPGEAHYRIDLHATLPANVHAYSVLPHGHYLLREIKAWAVRPDGSTARLLWIDDWDFNWQGQYHFAEPVPLPKGTKLHVVAEYDNSAANPANPNRPPKRVRFGPASTDEMLGCHIQILADGPADEAITREKWPYGL